MTLHNWRRPHRIQWVNAITIRPARSRDVVSIVALVDEEARRGNLLPRTAREVRAGLKDWFVAEAGHEKPIGGCISLLHYPSGLVEVRSLAVADRVQKQGVGRRLLKAAVVEAGRRGVPAVFALTRAVPFFQSCGFQVAERTLFPEKVWHACRFCPKQTHCDETAVVLDLTDSKTESQLTNDWPVA